MIKNILKNKRGDIPITILVMGVLAICILTIISFYVSNQQFRNNLDSVNIMEEVLLKAEKISLYKDLYKESGVISEEINENSQIKLDVQRGEYIEIMMETVSVKYFLP